MKLTIGYLYGDLMNIYGDTGNIIALKKRTEWRGIEVEVRNISIGDVIKPGSVDLYFFGGGQDQSQIRVAEDLVKTGSNLSKSEIIREDVEKGVPLLAICGGYQLLGEYYQPHEGPKLKGTGLFPAYTKASHDRMIGNIVVEIKNAELEMMNDGYRVVGFENHSGKTYLKEGGQPLGGVVAGFGNNGEDKTEGCVYKNAIGCYMHGSLLPKNPQLADWLLQKALETKYSKEIILKHLDDTLEIQAHNTVIEKVIKYKKR